MEEYFDNNGIKVMEGDRISFTLYDGEENVERDVKYNDKVKGLTPSTMKYLEFKIIQFANNKKRV
jgi:hypothetical protein